MRKDYSEEKDSSFVEDFFDSDYLFLYESRLAKRLEYEINFLIEEVFDEKTKSILDIPSGYGRHALVLAEKGYFVTGIDNSKKMLEEAEKRKKKLPVEIQKRVFFKKRDMRKYSSFKKFDVALSLFSSFGYFKDSKSNEDVVKTLCSNVKTSGYVVIDVRNPIRDIVDFSKTNWETRETADGAETIQKIDPISLTHTLTYKYKSQGGQPCEKTASWKHFLFPELERMLKENGCEVFKTYGNFKAESYSPESSRLIIVAKKS